MFADYPNKCAKASKEQGIDEIVTALALKGIRATSEQTGGFTMCAYVDLGNGFYIYANRDGASVYNPDDYEGDVKQFDEPQSAEVIATEIYNYIKNK